MASRMRSTYGLAQPRPEAAADHDGLDVEHVDGRGDPGAERLDRALDQLGGQLVAGSSARAHTPEVSRGRPRFSMILNRSVLRPRLCSRRARISIAPRPA